MDCGTGQASYGTLQRSCLTSVACNYRYHYHIECKSYERYSETKYLFFFITLVDKAGIRKRPRSGLQDKTNICSFIDHLDEDLHSDAFQEQISGNESEEDCNAVAYDSDFEGYSLTLFLYIYIEIYTWR